MVKVGCTVIRQLPPLAAPQEFDLKGNFSKRSGLHDICYLSVIKSVEELTFRRCGPNQQPFCESKTQSMLIISEISQCTARNAMSRGRATRSESLLQHGKPLLPFSGRCCVALSGVAIQAYRRTPKRTLGRRNSSVFPTSRARPQSSLDRSRHLYQS
jgi:hypothetical protein